MASDRDSQPLLQVCEDLGAIKAGVSNLQSGQREVREHLKTLVTREECKDQRRAITRTIADRHSDEVTGVRAAPTNGLLERLGKKAGAIATILALLAMLGGAFLVLSRFIGQVETALLDNSVRQERSERRMIKEIRSAPSPTPVMVPQPIVVHPDAGRRRRLRRHRHR